jgi:PAS domain S-box-containing protein
MCLGTLAVVRVVLSNLHEQRAGLAGTESAADRLMDGMGQGFADAQNEVNHVLALRPSSDTAQDWALTMRTALDRFNESDTPSGMVSTQALASLIEPMTELHSASLGWRDQVLANTQSIAELKRKAESELTAMRANISSEEGRQRLQIAKLVRQFRAQAGADSTDLAKQIIASIGPSDQLTETTVEMDNLSLLCEQLIGETEADRLADIKDNQFCASLIRLRAAIGRSQSISAEIQLALKTGIARFEASVFGDACVIDSDQHLIRIGEDGLYSRCVHRLNLQQQKEELRNRLGQQADGFKMKFSQLHRRYAVWRDVMSIAIERKLGQAWTVMLVLSIAGGGGLLAMGNQIARSIRRQIVRVENMTAHLARTNAQMAAIHRTSLDGVVILDSNWATLDVNGAAEQVFGGKKGDLIGRRLDSLIVSQLATGADPLTRLLQTAPGTRTTDVTAAVLGRRLEVIGKRGDGQPFPAEISITAAAVVGSPLYVASIRDISEQKRAETEREELHDRLLTASRQAGMAEVATGVLHNVGNILNSVNVAAGIISEKLQKSEVGSLKKAADMLRDHLHDLPTFLATDKRGQHLPPFLIEVAGCLEDERRAVLPELDVVGRGLEHIKHIITAQQSHAKGGIVIQRVNPSELINTALDMHRESFTRHQVQVDCRLEELGELPLDKHKALQILVNLITNAKNAVCEGRATDRCIRIILSAVQRLGAAEQTISFRVEDNGMGIAPEDLAKIFAHGFTTRKEGHGFGLHSAANAAKEMGGSLLVESDGVGRGAGFTLQIPIRNDVHANRVGRAVRDAA